jgi:hypothetical protein
LGRKSDGFEAHSRKEEGRVASSASPHRR